MSGTAQKGLQSLRLAGLSVPLMTLEEWLKLSTDGWIYQYLSPLVVWRRMMGETLLFSSLPGGRACATRQIVLAFEDPILFFSPHLNSALWLQRELFVGLVGPQIVASLVCGRSLPIGGWKERKESWSLWASAWESQCISWNCPGTSLSNSGGSNPDPSPLSLTPGRVVLVQGVLVQKEVFLWVVVTTVYYSFHLQDLRTCSSTYTFSLESVGTHWGSGCYLGGTGFWVPPYSENRPQKNASHSASPLVTGQRRVGPVETPGW